MMLSELVTRRYTSKAFDSSRKLSPAQVEEIKTLLRYSPSSTNSQPWHFVLAGTEEGKARIAKATSGRYEFNAAKVLNASHVVVFCTRASIDDDHLQRLLNQEEQDGRLPTAEAKQNQHAGRSHFVNMHRYELKDAQHWMEKQVYLALGTALLGASVLGIDACPIEGFDATILNEELGLRQQGYTASVLLALGHHAESDFNKHLPKSRLPQSDVISEI